MGRNCPNRGHSKMPLIHVVIIASIAGSSGLQPYNPSNHVHQPTYVNEFNGEDHSTETNLDHVLIFALSLRTRRLHVNHVNSECKEAPSNFPGCCTSSHFSPSYHFLARLTIPTFHTSKITKQKKKINIFLKLLLLYFYITSINYFFITI
jgi:hypothetical protein